MIPRLTWLALASCSLASTARAADEVERHYQLGTALAAQRNYIEALREMERAYQFRQSAVLTYNVGILHCKLGHREDAQRFFELYQAKAKRGADPQMTFIYQECLRKLPPPPQEEPEPPPAPLSEQPVPDKPAPLPSPPLGSLPPPTHGGGIQRAPRPLWRIALGGSAVAVGLGLIGAGGWAAGVHGHCLSPPVPPALVCDEIYQTQATGGILLTLGIVLSVGGALTIAWPGPVTATRGP